MEYDVIINEIRHLTKSIDSLTDKLEKYAISQTDIDKRLSIIEKQRQNTLKFVAISVPLFTAIFQLILRYI